MECLRRWSTGQRGTMVHGRLSQGVPIDIACRLYDIQPAANGAASEQRTHGHEAEGRTVITFHNTKFILFYFFYCRSFAILTSYMHGNKLVHACTIAVVDDEINPNL
jgi:hypothetical protein